MITFSSKSQGIFNGAKEYLVWYHRDNGSSRLLGVAYKTNHGDWCAIVDNGKGGKHTHLHRTFKTLKESVTQGWV